MPLAEWILLLANAVYGTSYVTTRLVLDRIPPATLGLLRLAIGAAILVPLAIAGAAAADPRRPTSPLRWAIRAGVGAHLSRADRWSVCGMGLVGTAGAFACFHWGLAHSTATNAALLVTVEPVALILLSPIWLGERLTRREAGGAALALAGAGLVVINGIPGLSVGLAPHWKGDLLLVLSGVAYASYSLFGRDVLARHRALPVTAWSVLWGAAGMLPLAALEWGQGRRPVWTTASVGGSLYLAVVMTALGYLVWNYALERVPAPRAAIFLNVQPLVGALLGVVWLSEPLTLFTVAGAALVVAGLSLTVKPARAG